MIAVALLGVVLILIGAIRNGHSGEEQAAHNATNPKTTLSPEEIALQDESRRIMDEAVIRAAQYDYDGAIALLDSYSGDPAQVDGMLDARANYIAAKGTLVPWEDNTTIPHFSFQPLIADPDRAFDGDDNESSYKNYNFTIPQFTEILQQMYDNGYVLVSMHDLAIPVVDSEGNVSFEPTEILLPEGKKPLLLSQVPVNYYLDTVDSDDDGQPDAKGDGFACRLVVGSDGKVTNEMVNANGETVRGAFDLVPVLNAFIEKNPSFSYRGAKAILGVTGFDGIMGHRGADAQAAAKAVAQALLNDGYSFACFSYGNVPYGDVGLNELTADLESWQIEVEPVIGKTDTLFYFSGSDLTDVDSSYSGDKYDALYAAGFRYYVGMSSQVWNDFGDDYVRQSRCTVNPSKLSDSPAIFKGIFTASEILALR